MRAKFSVNQNPLVDALVVDQAMRNDACRDSSHGPVLPDRVAKIFENTSVVTMPFMPISAPAEQSPLYAPMTSWFQSISSHFCILRRHVFVPLMMLFDEIACVCETEERHFSFFDSDRDINFSKSSTSTPWLPHHVGVLMRRFPALSYSGSESDSSAFVLRRDCVWLKRTHEEVVLEEAEEVLAEVVVGEQCCLG